MPSMIGKEKKKKDLIQNLDKIFEQIQVSEMLYYLVYCKTLAVEQLIN